MNYESKYNELVEAVRAVVEGNPGLCNIDEGLGRLRELLPERESEDERIRRLLVWQVHRNIEDETNDLAQSVYDGIKGHDPELEESIKDWKKCLAYLEKQKEQKPLSTEETELNSIAFLEKLGYTCIPPGAEQKTTNSEKPKEWSEEEKGILLECVSVLQNSSHWLLADKLSSLLSQPKQEWSEEDKEKITFLERLIRYNVPEGQYGWADGHKGGFVTKLEAIFMLKSLRPQPHWKPSEEQMEAVFDASERNDKLGSVLTTLYHDLKKL